MNEVLNFYRGKTVFLTGHTGFKGCWLSLWLKSLGATVIGYALPPQDNQEKFFQPINSKSEFYDILDYDKLKLCIKNSNPDIVFHFAAQSLVLESLINPRETFNTNIIGTVNLLEAIREVQNVKAVINVTTDKCYYNNEWCWPYRETDNLGGKDPYSSSKAASELITIAYQFSYFKELGIHIATARAGNVIGGGDFNSDRLIPDIIKAISNNKPVLLRNPNSTRPWQHVFDALYGYLILGKKLYEDGDLYAQAFNFGPDIRARLTVLDIATNLINKMGKGSIQCESIENSLYEKESKMLILDSSKAKQMLQWETLLTNEQMLNFTATWYEKFFENKTCMKDFSLNQIEQYSQLIIEKKAIEVRVNECIYA